MGLMKISTYHKSKGDNVFFYKGNMSKIVFTTKGIGRVYITSLFTFYYNKTINTINWYRKLIASHKIFLGGIMVSLMAEEIRKDVGEEVNIVIGQLVNSDMLGFSDDINIDTLPLDYFLLDEIQYKYPAADSYLGYTSRGCTNKCSFCAVPILEPKFFLTNNIIKQVETIKKLYGEKGNLLLLDNNILSFNESTLNDIVNDLRSLGYDGESRFFPELPLNTYMKKLNAFPSKSQAFENILAEAVRYLKGKRSLKMNPVFANQYEKFLTELDVAKDKYAALQRHQRELVDILTYYYRTPGRARYVDFNQGLDARQLNEAKMSILSKLPIRPFRLAFDNMKYAEIYKRAVRLAASYGITHFSNYILYNFDDTPAELWERLKINIDLVKELNVKIFSFPMKYVPIHMANRSYIGTHWNKHYLSNVYAILNVTKGIVAGGESFFFKAFGENITKFEEILMMPRNFVLDRDMHAKSGLIQQWQSEYSKMFKHERQDLLNILCSGKKFCEKNYTILDFYNIKNNN